MRIALALAVLTLPIFGQDTDGPAGQPDNPLDAARAGQESAAALFYRAFWIEQAKRNVEEAEALYAEVIKNHAAAPEAPRAFLALIRLRAARGVEVDELVRQLEQAYPKLTEEIERARRLAARLRSDFDPTIKSDETPLMLKLKGICSDLFVGTNQIRPEDKDFLSDVGAAGHPMLAYVLRASDSGAVKQATALLLGQSTSEANAVIDTALRDPALLYRMSIIDQLRRYAAYEPAMMKTLHEIWPQASRSMRRRIASTWAAGTRSNSLSLDSCYAYLAMAVEDEDSDVRRAATLLADPQSHVARPEAYVRAVLARCGKDDAAVQGAWQWLPWQLKHAPLAPAIIDALGKYEGVLQYHGDYKERLEEDVAVAMATMAIARVSRSDATLPPSDTTLRFAILAAMSSGKAASLLLDASLRLGRAELAYACGGALSELRLTDAARDEFVFDAARVRARAIDQSYSDDARERGAAEAVLTALRLRADDFATVIRTARAHPDRGLVERALGPSFLLAVGPERAAELVPLATDAQLDVLVESGKRCLDLMSPTEVRTASNVGPGLPFWAALLARFKPTAASSSLIFQQLSTQSPAAADLVAAWCLGRDDEAMQWKVPGRSPMPGRSPSGFAYGPTLTRSNGIAEALGRAPLRDRTYAMTGDKRYEIARLGLRLAEQDPGDGALAAYRNAFESPWVEIVDKALGSVRHRGPAGAAILAEYLQRPNLKPDYRMLALREFGQSEAKDQLPYIRQRLDARCDGYEASVMWELAQDYDGPATTERALTEVFGEGPADYRTAALKVLARSSDPRRIPIFGKVLRESKDTDQVHSVLRTVADQYLIELGPEVLLHLRNPDDGIRNTATTAIERLKFYAEAKKLFDTEGK